VKYIAENAGMTVVLIHIARVHNADVMTAMPTVIHMLVVRPKFAIIIQSVVPVINPAILMNIAVISNV
ncbi:MAG: hypothetical protein N3B13_12805, partial [Deltaproteobacteria bacterium]|nr:hypothetical protein [Deltaproteobacteria bacterium]